ncbi:hypothetical protein [Sporosarcina sp. FSL K6-1508]|uniref:hypothetical protein n=1 Tax=Sporosarcina sp. FSL K6-1508 TaxID=2921553 RepID=UPI0030FCCEF0
MRNDSVKNEVEVLLINHSDEKVDIIYNSNPIPVRAPKIGMRPPFYWNPQYVHYYPTI